LEEIKTKEIAKILKNLNVEGKALIVTPELDKNIVLSGRNIPGIKTTFATLLNTYDIMDAKTFVVDKAALPMIEEVYA
jgi:large subunit ribosomal protein L4